MRTHDAGERAFVGNGERRVAELCGALSEFLGVRRAPQEREIGEAEKLGIRRQHAEAGVHGASPEEAVQEPAWFFFRVAAAHALAINPVAALVVRLGDEVVARHQFAVEPARLDALAWRHHA